MRLSDLLPNSLTETTLPTATGELAVTGLSEDSRKIRSGHLFFAIAGTKSDGRQFCKNAVDAGAIAIVTDNRDLDDDLDALVGGWHPSHPDDQSPAGACTGGRQILATAAIDDSRRHRHQWQDFDRRISASDPGNVSPGTRPPRHAGGAGNQHAQTQGQDD